MPAKTRSSRTKDEVLSKKSDYITKVINCLEEYPRFLVVTCDFIGSKHMQQIRLSLRDCGAVLLMGKNTLMRKAIKMKLEDHPDWEPLLPVIRDNVGLVLTKGSLSDLKSKIQESTVPASVKAGILAPDDVILRKQVTTLEPTKTSFFAALNVETKITKGCVEILSDLKLCSKGKKVGTSETTLLQMLNIKPFTYGLKVTHCWDQCLGPFIYSDSSFEESFSQIVMEGFKNVVSVGLETGCTFPQMEEIKRKLENIENNPVIPEDVHETTETDTDPVQNSDDEGLIDFFSF